jgi:hypothetical protein
MHRFLTVLLWSTQVICIGLLWFSCFPGALADASMPFFWLMFLLVAHPIGILIGLILPAVGLAIWRRSRWSRDRQPPRSSPRSPPSNSPIDLPIDPPNNPPGGRSPRRPVHPALKRLVIATLGAVFLTSVLIRTNLPQVLAFSISRPAFEVLLADPVKLENLCGQRLPQQVGLYFVVECDRDPRGGVYFSTGSHGGFLFDSDTYGFVYQPNAHGSQRFGEDSYEYYPVVDGWYWFRAGRDWL